MPSGRFIRGAVPAILICAIAAAALLSGCGGDGSDDTSVSSNGAEAANGGRAGSRAAARGVPLAKGGDNSIQTYGVEAPRADRARATAVAKAYLGARANRDWGKACSYLVTLMRAKLAQLAKYSKGRAAGCAGAMESFAAQTPKAELRAAADIEALSLRVKGPQGFLIYRDDKGEPYDLSLNLLGGDWKVAALTGIPLALGES